jgi:hypothetical protein
MIKDGRERQRWTRRRKRMSEGKGASTQLGTTALVTDSRQRELSSSSGSGKTACVPHASPTDDALVSNVSTDRVKPTCL